MGVATAPPERVQSIDAPAPPATLVEPEVPPPARRFRWFVPQTVRGRMVALFVTLLVAAGALTVTGIQTILITRLEQRTQEALEQEIEEVQILLTQGTDPLTGQPFSTLARAFDVYFDRNVPSVQEAHIAFLDGELYRDRLRSFPLQQLPMEPIDDWATFSSTGSGVMNGDFATTEGSVKYRAAHVEVAGQQGAFVVAILPELERREIRDLQTYGALVVACVVILAGVCTGLLADRIVAPVRELTETARSISEADRDGRVREVGSAEAVEMARHFNAMLDRLDAVHYSQLEFLQAVGHELRTPLTVATGHLELLDDDDPDRRAAVELVIGELARMGRLVDDLQTLAEAEREDYVRRSDVEVESFAHELLAKSVVLGDRRWRMDEVRGSTFRADPERLTEAALNLVDNALKHTTECDEIAIGVVIDDGEVQIRVRDTGPGVDASDGRDLFERFVRGAGADRRYRGSGLGLAIARSIAEAHGGEVELEVSATGAVFCIRFPSGVEP